MNWIERMYEIKGKDLYSQNGEGLLLEYIFHSLKESGHNQFIDIGAGDGFHLSNTKHLRTLGWYGIELDTIQGQTVTRENLLSYFKLVPSLISIDIDGNDYWLLEEIFKSAFIPPVIIAEFNPAFTDSRTIKYNPDHVWAGDDYYGFSFEAGNKLSQKYGYTIIFIVANMNLIMVRNDLIKGLHIPSLAYWTSDYFNKSNRPDSDWVWI